MKRGLKRQQRKTFLRQQLLPFNTEQTGYIGGLLKSWRKDDDLRAALEPDDRTALTALTDVNRPSYALARSDLYLLGGATVYSGWT